MITLEGRSALSPFRRERLQFRMSAINAGVRLIDTRRCYFIAAEPGESPDAETLARILDAAAASVPPAEAQSVS